MTAYYDAIQNRILLVVFTSAVVYVESEKCSFFTDWDTIKMLVKDKAFVELGEL
jgi:hypothetical protein